MKAKEARQLSEKHVPVIDNPEKMKTVFDNIKKACLRGEFSTGLDLTPKEADTLREMGYRLSLPYSTSIVPNQYYHISWYDDWRDHAAVGYKKSKSFAQ